MRKIILPILLLVAISGSGQIHVADTILSEQQGLAFLKWCFTHPDTVYREMSPGGGPVMEAQADQYNQDLILRAAWIIPYYKNECPDSTPDLFKNCWHKYIIPKLPAEISLRQWIRSRRK